MAIQLCRNRSVERCPPTMCSCRWFVSSCSTSYPGPVLLEFDRSTGYHVSGEIFCFSDRLSLFRSEGKAGVPLRLTINVLDTRTCSPLINALVDLWHCDTGGLYSHFLAASLGQNNRGTDNSTFLRGKSFSLLSIRSHRSR